MAPALALKATYRSKKVREWLPTSTTKQLAMLWIGHLVLGVALRHTGRLGLAHALITLFAGLFLALQARKAVTVAYVAAYIVGSEVLWRMAGAGLVWEIAKYELVVISVWTMFRLRQRRIPWAPVFYIMLQLPAAVLTYGYMSFSPYFRKAAMFNLSGPLALAATACFFFSLKITREELWRIILLFAAPTLSMVAFGVSTMREMADDLNFTGSSNPLAAGGFGPNQVSAVLGLSTALLLLYLVSERMSILRQVIVLIGFLLVGGQSAMTFSRSGLYAAAASIAPALFFLALDSRTRARVGRVMAVVAVVSVVFVIPLLVRTTGGAITKRFANTGLTGRDQLMKNDMQAWKENPVFGAGLGMTPFLYHTTGLPSHNELTRLLADHGSLGFLAALLLIWFSFSQFLSHRGMLSKALISAAFTWSFLFMLANGFRLAAPAFAYGLGCVSLVSDPVRRAPPRLASEEPA